MTRFRDHLSSFFGTQSKPHGKKLQSLLNEIEQLTDWKEMPQRVETCRQAISLVDPREDLELWAKLHKQLADSLRRSPTGSRFENFEEAIECCQKALQVYTIQFFSVEWAETMHSLGTIYLLRLRGERADNIEKAIECFQNALKVRTRSDYPNDWASTLNNLVSAYINRIRGNRADNLEQAIYYSEQALEVRTKRDFPLQWAKTHDMLGSAYFYRILGESRVENLELAIFHCNESLEVFTQNNFPVEWAEVQNNLGEIYRERIKGDSAVNIERAIEHYNQALQVFTQESFHDRWAFVNMNLGSAFNQRIRGERTNNQEQAILCCQQALQVLTQTKFPQDWAQACANLGNVYQKRISGKQEENLQQAIHFYQEALKVFNQNEFPEHWALIQNSLGVAYENRIQGERSTNIRQAISCYQRALEVRTQSSHPVEWALTQYNIAALYAKSVKGGRPIDIDTKYSLDKSTQLAKDVLKIQTPETLPRDCRNTAFLLGITLYSQQHYSDALAAFATAHTAIQNLRGEAPRQEAKRRLSQENAELYAFLVTCCLHENDTIAAFEYTAVGKGRALVDMLASTRFDLLAAAADDPQLAQDWQHARALRQQIDNIQMQLTNQSGAATSDGAQQQRQRMLYDELRSLQQQEKTLWEDLSYKYPALTATQQAPMLTATNAQALARELDATLVEYYRHAEEWCAFVVSPGGIHHVHLPGITDDLLERMRDWLSKMDSDFRTSPMLMGKPLHDWHAAVIAPLRDYLPLCGRVVLSPHWVLNLFPIGAARDPQSEYYACEDYLLTFAPSLSALWVMHQQATKTGSKAHWQNGLRVFSAAYAPDIEGLVPATQQTVQAFAPNLVDQYQQVTPDAIIAAARQQPAPDILHIAAHGNFDMEQPEQSGLALHDGWLTVQRIISEMPLQHTQLVTLASCLLGRASLEQSGEAVGITQAFLTVGARSVVTALWSVEVNATMKLFQTFYRHIMDGKPPAVAMRAATAEIRATPGWEHPYYWVAFQVYGLAF